MSNELRRWMTLVEARRATPAERFVQQIDTVLARKPGIRASFYAEDDLAVSLQHIATAPTGAGIGSWAMKMITRLADRLGITISLEALAEEEGMDQDRLVEFYKRFGFEGALRNGEMMMWRNPKTRLHDPRLTRSRCHG